MEIDRRYALNGETHIAYHVVGRGDVDLVFVPSFISNIEGGKVEVNGSLSLDGASSFEFEDGLQAKPHELTVAGHADLGSAMLILLENCLAPGTKFTLIEAKGGVSGHFTGPGQMPIANGQVIEPAAPGGCNPGEPTPQLRIEYGAQTVTATVLGAATPSPSPPGGGGTPPGTGGTVKPHQGIAAYRASAPRIVLGGRVRVRPGTVLVPLRCVSTEKTCWPVVVRLTVLEHLLDGRVTGSSAARGGHTTRTVVLGSTREGFRPGEKRIVSVSLDSAALASSAGQGQVEARLGVVFRGRTVRSQAVRIPPAVGHGR